MGNLGRTVQPYRSGYDDSIIAGSDTQWLMVGASIDWATVVAVSADTTLPSGRLVRAGQKYLRNGQVMTRITGGAATVATLNNTPTGGTFTVSVTQGGATTTTTALAFNATGATVQTALRLLANVDAASTVSGSASGPYTFGFPASMGTTTVTGSGTALTGAGSQPTITFAATADGRSRWFGPYDPAATDGRQTLHRGDVGLIERTLVLDGSLGLGDRDDVHKGIITGGQLWGGKVLHSGVATHSLILGPTQAELEAVLPTVVLIYK